MSPLRKNQTLGAKHRMDQRQKRLNWNTFRAEFGLSPLPQYISGYNLTVAEARTEKKKELDAESMAPMAAGPIFADVHGKDKTKASPKPKQNGQVHGKEKEQIVKSGGSSAKEIKGKGKGKIVENEEEFNQILPAKISSNSRNPKENKIGVRPVGATTASEVCEAAQSSSPAVSNASRLVFENVQQRGITMARYHAGHSDRFILAMAQEILKSDSRSSTIFHGVFKSDERQSGALSMERLASGEMEE